MKSKLLMAIIGIVTYTTVHPQDYHSYAQWKDATDNYFDGELAEDSCCTASIQGVAQLHLQTQNKPANKILDSVLENFSLQEDYYLLILGQCGYWVSQPNHPAKKFNYPKTAVHEPYEFDLWHD